MRNRHMAVKDDFQNCKCSENDGSSGTLRSSPHPGRTPCAGVGTGRDSKKCVNKKVISLFPEALTEDVIESKNPPVVGRPWKKLNLKYFSGVKNSPVKIQREHSLTEDGIVDRNLPRVSDFERTLSGIINGSENLAPDRHDGSEPFLFCKCDIGVNVDSKCCSGCEPEAGTVNPSSIAGKNDQRHYLLECSDGDAKRSDDTSKISDLCWKLIPCQEYLYFRDRGCERGNTTVCNHCYAVFQKVCAGLEDGVYDLLHSGKIDSLTQVPDYERYILVPKQTYCMKPRRKQRRKDSFDFNENFDSYTSTDSFYDFRANSSDVLNENADNVTAKNVAQQRGESVNLAHVKLGKPVSMPEVIPEMKSTRESSDTSTSTNSPRESLTDAARKNGESSNPPESNLDKNREQTPSVAGGEVEPKSNAESYDASPKKGLPGVQEIKYYEGSFNIFGAQEGKDSQSSYPYIKITKTVTFEKEKGGEGCPSDKALGIDSWMQTDDANDEEESKGTRREDNNLSDDCQMTGVTGDKFFECAKICCECLKALASSKLQSEGAALQGPEKSTKKADDLRMEKPQDRARMTNSPATSRHPNNYDNEALTLTGNDLMKFIAELFLEAIPKEIYNRMMGVSGATAGKYEEFEVRVKSYDKEGTDTCSEKNCKGFVPELQNDRYKEDLIPTREQVKNQRMMLDSSTANPCCPCVVDQQGNVIKGQMVESPRNVPTATNRSEGVRKRQEEATYDCQIILNGRKILVKVNRSVEDLLFSGTVESLMKNTESSRGLNDSETGRQSKVPAGIASNPSLKSSQPLCNVSRCTCPEKVKHDPNVPGKPDEKYHGNEQGMPGKRFTSYTDIETGRYQKKFDDSNDSQPPGRNPKPVLTSPPTYNEPRKTGSERPAKQNDFDNSRNLYFCNVEVTKQITESRRNVDNRENPARMNKPYSGSNRVDYFDRKGSSRRIGNDAEVNNVNRIGRRLSSDYPYKVSSNSRRQSGKDEKKNKNVYEFEQRGHATRKVDQNCLPLYWESHMKFCDQIMSKESDKTEKYTNYKSNMRDGTSRCIMNTREIEKRVVMSPGNYTDCNGIDSNAPMYLFNISDSENCRRSRDGRGFRDFTAASLASIKLNSNPFDEDSITCSKCIETLKACSGSLDKKWPGEKGGYVGGSFSDANHSLNLCDYYWNESPIQDANLGEFNCSGIISKCMSAGEESKSAAAAFTDGPATAADGFMPNASSSRPNVRRSAGQDARFVGYNRSLPNCCCMEPHGAPFPQRSVVVDDIRDNDAPVVFQTGPAEKFVSTGTQFPGSDRCVRDAKSRGICLDIIRTDSSSREENVSLLLNKNKIFCKHLSPLEGIGGEVSPAGMPLTKGLEIHTDGKIAGSAAADLAKFGESKDKGSGKFIVSDSDKSVFFCNVLQGKPNLLSDGVSSADDLRKISLEDGSCAINLMSTTSCIIDDGKRISLETIRSADRVLLKSDQSPSVDSFQIKNASDGNGKSSTSISKRRFTFKKPWRWWRRKKV